jgi:penicillin-binding protein 2
MLEVNSSGKIVSDNMINPPRAGENIHLSIDAFLQNKMSVALSNYIKEEKFIGGAGAMMDIQTGEILAMVSLPEYSSAIMTDGSDRNQIAKYIFDEAKPFLNKALYGEYTPGSIVKPFVAIAALDQGIITENEKMYTDGKLVIPNRYFPSKPSIFRDWKDHGIVNIKDAIAVSSNVFFYTIGGGFGGKKGLGIEEMEKNYRNFGFGEKTNIQEFAEKNGQIPNPE